MLFEQFEEKGLSQYSYIVGCKTTKQVAVIDPRFDVDIYLDYAEKNGLVISHVFETHIHADYVSGARYLASRVGATLALSGYDKGERYEVAFPHRECLHGDVFHIGEVSLLVMHTPGHTPEHISLLASQSGRPEALFSGDFLLADSVGRPDLIGKEETASLARELYRSLQASLGGLPDHVAVFPAHGAGSFCASGAIGRSSSTLGEQRRSNPFLRADLGEEGFVALLLARLPFCPDYFMRIKEHNSGEKRNSVVPTVSLDLDTFKEELEGGACVIDLRSPRAFSRGHIPGAFCIGGGEKVGFWASMVVPYDAPILIVTEDPLTVPEAIASLARVGLCDIRGYLKEGMDCWEKGEEPTTKITEIQPHELHSLKERARIIDVRTPAEWMSGHIESSFHTPCSEVHRDMEAFPEGELVFVCTGGYRSILAASVARRSDLSVTHLSGGILAWKGAGLPLVL